MKPPLPKFRLKHLLVLLLLLAIPLLLFAQGAAAGRALAANSRIVHTIGLLSPFAISPFWALFLTSAASLFGFGGSYLEAHPILGNWVALIISFLLVVVTTLPNFFKVSKPIGLTANYLEDKAGLVINALILALPFFLDLTEAVAPNALGVKQGAIVSLPVIGVLIALLTAGYFIVVMTVRYFLEILIFLSPIPLLDAFFEVAKKMLTLGLVIIYFLFPPLALGVSVLIFLVAFVLFRRARRGATYFRYVFVEPILTRMFDRRTTLISESVPANLRNRFSDIKVALRALSIRRVQDIRQKSLVWLIRDQKGLWLVQTRFLRPPLVLALDPGHLTLAQDLYYQIITNERDVKLLLNTTHAHLRGDIVAQLGIPYAGTVGLARAREEFRGSAGRGWRRLLDLFNGRQLVGQRGAVLGE